MVTTTDVAEVNYWSIIYPFLESIDIIFSGFTSEFLASERFDHLQFIIVTSLGVSIWNLIAKMFNLPINFLISFEDYHQTPISNIAPHTSFVKRP